MNSYLGFHQKFHRSNDGSLCEQGLYPCDLSNTKSKEFNMAGVNEKSEFGRIEDFIALAKEGKDVHAEIGLKKQVVAQKVHPDETEDMKGEIDMYLLIADYIFRVGKDMKLVFKVYMFGSSEESPDAAKVNKSIANTRLKVDYQRMRDAKITFEEKYF
jgi:hypothetical protein